MKTIISSKSKKTCEQCGSHNIKTRLATYPVKIGPKQLDIGRVSVRECGDCHTMIPTKAGQEKITRCTTSFISLLDRNL